MVEAYVMSKGAKSDKLTAKYIFDKEQIIGVGRFGRVYRGTNTSGHPVAVKLLRDEREDPLLSSADLKTAFEIALTYQNSTYGGPLKHVLVVPEFVGETTIDGKTVVCGVMPLKDCDSGLLIDRMNGILTFNLNDEKYKRLFTYPHEPSNFKDARWTSIASTIGIQLLYAVVEIHKYLQKNTPDTNHGDVIPTNVLIDGIELTLESNWKEKMLSTVDPAQIKVYLADIVTPSMRPTKFGSSIAPSPERKTFYESMGGTEPISPERRRNRFRYTEFTTSYLQDLGEEGNAPIRQLEDIQLAGRIFMELITGRVPGEFINEMNKNRSFLPSAKLCEATGQYVPQGVCELVWEMAISPSKSAMNYLELIIKKFRPSVITKYIRDTDQSMLSLRDDTDTKKQGVPNVLSIERPYHVFIKFVGECSETIASTKLPASDAVSSLELLYNAAKIFETARLSAAKNLGLVVDDKKKPVQVQSIQTLIDALASTTSHMPLMANPLDFNLEEVNALYNATKDLEPNEGDKVHINTAYVKLKKEMKTFFTTYTKLAEARQKSIVEANGVVRGLSTANSTLEQQLRETINKVTALLTQL